MGSWTGAESAKSAAITVANSTFVLNSTAPITALPAIVTGTISNFTLADTLTYHLDSTTGPVLAGSPSTVTNSTSMAVSVTVPAGTTDAPHSLFVVGSSGPFAAASINIVVPPVLQSMQMRDINGNGKVDQVTVVFDDTLGDLHRRRGAVDLDQRSVGRLVVVGQRHRVDGDVDHRRGSRALPTPPSEPSRLLWP